MDTKRELIRVAGKLFAERGFRSTSIREIAKVAGCNLGAIGYHFGSKEALFAAVIQRKIEPLKKKVQTIAGSDGSPSVKLREILQEYAMHVLHRDPALKAFFSEAIHGGQHLPPQAIGSFERRDQIIGKIIREGIKQGAFRRCNVKHATWIFFGTLAPFILYQPFLSPKRKCGPYPKAEIRKITDSAWDIFINGMKEEEGGQHEN